ncbi:MAG: hypothetical protein PHG97_01090 [Candidatus Margulisbacteria bacterium]|nr:hypothetical protein [Candidatus Margulisiibacteriota bacterium]
MAESSLLLAQFKREVGQNVQFYTDLLKAIDKKINEKSLHSMLATQLTFTLFSLWEAFLSDIFISYVRKSPSKAIKNLRAKVNKSLYDKFGSDVSRNTHLNLGNSLSWHTATSILDPKEWNITRVEPVKFTQLANENLSARHAKLFSFTEKDTEFYKFTKKMRNYLAHGSIASRRELGLAIKSIENPDNLFLKARLGEIGPYLKQVVTGKSRVLLIADRLLQFADQLV